MPYIIIDSIKAHADAPNNLVAEYRAWASKADADRGLLPVKQDTHTQQMPPRRVAPQVDAGGNFLLLNGTPISKNDLDLGGEVAIRARLQTPDYRAVLLQGIQRVVKSHLGDARDGTIPTVTEDSEGALAKAEVTSLVGVGREV